MEADKIILYRIRVHLWLNLTAAINVSRMFLNGEQSNH